MGLNTEVLDSVAFVATIKNDIPTFRGTMFFIEEDAGIGSDSREKIWGYLATAKHVAEKIADGQALARLNKMDGSLGWKSFKGARWWFHPTDRTTDVALIRWAPPADVVRYKRWNIRDFVTDKMVRDGAISIHDDIQTIGLFRAHPGSAENAPVLRSGNVAMLPKDPVQTRYGPMDAYLVESRSIGGLSGSPVIVTQTMVHKVGAARVKGIGDTRLFGLVHGHHDIVSEKASDPETEILNSGIAVVVPAQKILDIIGQPEMLALKKQELRTVLGG